jgi:hypothetical protein
MNTNLNQPYFKSAVAFFFLFFLHGTSIGNGQQGISANLLIHAIQNIEPIKNNANTKIHKDRISF